MQLRTVCIIYIILLHLLDFDTAYLQNFSCVEHVKMFDLTQKEFID